MEEYLMETPSIDYMNPLIQDKVQELIPQSEDEMDYIKRCYIFVRDEISHSWDIKTEVVSRTASEVLKNKTGICWTKSCLLAALLRANHIPSGISYQLLTRADDDSEGYMIHALNTLYLKDFNKWIRLDARGNKENINAGFSLDEECLAYSIRSKLGEIDYQDNHADLDDRLVDILMQSENILEITTDFEFYLY
ncbi:transglutaminase family protein [uncultured Methanobrevibacter sp.]|uniref:transglutaminase-like domain-containing protein n=1 Tax=uncultured Methanobrevibacter sp. TaxID=253161 RepID=UPI0025D8DACA|nr:transglutaminase-like domain-containing protein [uncultured Methanobrevibacter sp.]